MHRAKPNKQTTTTLNKLICCGGLMSGWETRYLALPGTNVTLTSIQSANSSFFPFLKMGTLLTIFQAPGNSQIFQDASMVPDKSLARLIPFIF